MFEQNLNRELDSQDLRESKWQDAYDSAYNQAEAVGYILNGDCHLADIDVMAGLFEVKPNSPGVPNDVIGEKFRGMVMKAAHELAVIAANQAEFNGFQD
jgi:hypothetical protein